MEAELLVFCLGALACVPLIWAVPRAYGPDAVALFGLGVLWSVSWTTAAMIVATGGLTLCALHLGRRLRRGHWVLAVAGVVLVVAFLAARARPAWEVMGMAYVTLRNLHLLFDDWMGSDDPLPSARDMAQYHLFLPVLGVGPIHRFAAFRRSLRTRHRDGAELARGAERALTSFAMAAILGSAAMATAQKLAGPALASLPPFWAALGRSALDWVQLYFVFAGMSGFAVGTAQMMGLRIEENFDRPYLATSLLEFWTRWHISLTTWCRDYVFQPVTAATRRPLAGLLAAMAVVGLWHETSVYYLLWSVWQVAGIVLNRVAIGIWGRLGLTLPRPVLRLVAPVMILGWLAAARPVITLLQGGAL